MEPRTHAWKVTAIVIGCAIGGARLTSVLYWGYFLEPPSAGWLVSDFAVVDRFTSRNCCDLTWAPSGPAGVRDAAAVAWAGPGDAPIRSLPTALLNPALRPRSSEPVPAALQTEIRDALDAAGALIPAESPDYKYAKELWGHVAVGRDARGRELVAAALLAGEVSNDHHPYYEAVLRRSPGGQLEVLRVRHFWWDFAGLEQIATFLGYLGGLLMGVIAAIGYTRYKGVELP